MTELMKRYEAETGKSSTQTITDGLDIWHYEYIEWLEAKVLDGEIIEKFQKIIRTQCDEISALKAQLTWRPVSEKPEKGQEVIISYVDCYGHRINVLGSYVRRFDEEAEPADDEDIMEYSDEKDEYYLKEGWYEHTTHSDYDCWLLHEKIDKWLPIPPAPEGEVK